MRKNLDKNKNAGIAPADSPLVSVIIPTYNRAHLLKESVESVVAQTWRPIELIIVDDGSTDNTEGECKRLREIANEQNVNFIYHHQKNAGVSTARNTGTKLATGEFIQYLDSDDLLHPQKLEAQVNFLLLHLKCGLCLSYATVSAHPLNHQWEQVLSAPIERHYWDYMVFRNFPTPLPLYRSKLLTALPEWEIKHSIREDTIFLIRAMIASEYIGIDRNNLVLIRDHDGDRLSRSTSKEKLVDNLSSARLFLNIAASTPTEYQECLVPSFLPHLLSCTKTCIARKWNHLAEGYLQEACRLPLSRQQQISVHRIRRTLRLPNILARLLFRLNCV